MWIGSLVFVVAGEWRLERRIVVWIAVLGKFVLAGVHAGVACGYGKYYGHLRQPSWVLVFLAAQAWWDLCVLGVRWCLLAVGDD